MKEKNKQQMSIYLPVFGVLMMVLVPATLKINILTFNSTPGLVYTLSLPLLLFTISKNTMIISKSKIILILTVLLTTAVYRDKINLGIYLTIVIIFLLSQLKPESLKILRNLIGLAFLFSIPLAIYQAYTNTWPVLDNLAIEGFGFGNHFNRAAGWIGHPIPYGIGFGAYIIFYWQRTKYISMSLCMLGLLLTQSRTPVIGLIVAVICSMIYALYSTILRKKIKRSSIIFAVFIPVVTLPLLYILSDRLSDRYLNVSNGYSAIYRNQQLELAKQIMEFAPIENKFFGFGGESSRQLIERSFKWGQLTGPPTFDNSLLTIWIEFGYVGISVITLILIYFLIKNRSPYLIYMIVCSLTFDAYKWPIIIILLVILINLDPYRLKHRNKHEYNQLNSSYSIFYF